MKAYTDINQSKKLADILPMESADMAYWKRSYRPNDYAIMAHHTKELQDGFEAKGIEYIPCWSLATLIDVLPVEVETHKQADGDKICYYVELYMKHDGKEIYLSTERHESLVDACYEMINKLNELKLL